MAPCTMNRHRNVFCRVIIYLNSVNEQLTLVLKRSYYTVGLFHLCPDHASAHFHSLFTIHYDTDL